MLFENLRKTVIYFQPWDAYWKLNSSSENLAVSPEETGRYPLDFKPRVREGHYAHFDENGVPMWPGTDGNYLYHYTTMCSYALAQSDFYLITGKEEHLSKVIAIADYILKSGVYENGGLFLREADKNGNHTGNISAMTQGEAMSVLCRAGEYSNQDRYIDSAEKLIVPFEIKIEKGGVVGRISKIDSLWYEEYVTEPLNHVLNGMIYSLWGLRDLNLVTGNVKAKNLYEQGVNYVTEALPFFDTGYWTYYWISESKNNYVASMMYHNLHICQLKALYEQTKMNLFSEYADKFIKYAKSPLCRLRAAKAIAFAKVSA